MGNSYLTILALMMLSLTGMSQRTSFTSGEEIVAEAISQFDDYVASEDFQSFTVLRRVWGVYSFDITIRAKGSKAEVSSVSVVSREDGDIPSQNALKDHVKDVKLKMKIPKSESYKFNYTFNLKP